MALEEESNTHAHCDHASGSRGDAQPYVALAKRLIGFIAPLPDHAQSALVHLLEVPPDCGRNGIDSGLASRMLRKREGIPAIDPTCDPDVRRFYS